MRTMVAFLLMVGVLTGRAAARGDAGAAGASPATAPSAVDAGFARLDDAIASLGPAGSKASSLANQAQAATADTTLCAAVVLLEQVGTALAGLVATIVPSVLAPVTAALLSVEALLLSDLRTKLCGGAKSAGSPGPMPASVATRSDNHVLQFHVVFPPPVFTSRTGGDATYVDMSAPGMAHQIEQYGYPDVPTSAVQFAVPMGAHTTVTVLGSSGYDLTGVSLWPTQQGQYASTPFPPAVSRPFVKNKAVYNALSPYPATPALGRPVTQMRDLQVGSVGLASAQYVPLLRTLHVLTAADVRVTFTGSATGDFATSRFDSVWNRAWLPVYDRLLLNSPTVSNYIQQVVLPTALCGEEMLIIASKENDPAAQKLAAARTLDGVVTTVEDVGSPAVGDTPFSIRNYIAAEYNKSCALRPSFVLLMGDSFVAGGVQTWAGARSLDPQLSSFEGLPASDMPYGLLHQKAQIDAGDWSDLLPDVAVARITGDATLTMQAVDKIIRYEDNPTMPTSFYNDVVAAAFFQHCPDQDCVDASTKKAETPSTQAQQGFVDASEASRGIAQSAGKTVTRVYADLYNDHPTTMASGAALDPSISWHNNILGGEGNAESVAAFNAGPSLVWQNDHGYDFGWAHPNFSTADVAGLTNGPANLPVVWNLDCDSAKFDQYPYVPGSPQSFSQALLAKPDGGAVGVIGSTRESWIDWDDLIGPTLSSAVFPQQANATESAVAASEGILVARVVGVTALAQTLLVGQIDTASEARALGGDVFSQPEIPFSETEYVALGDPSMNMWIAPPQYFDLTGFSSAVTPTSLSVTASAVPDGTVVTVLDQGVAVGRAVMEQGSAQIATTTDLTGTNGAVAVFRQDGYVSGRVTLDYARPHISSIDPTIGPSTGGTDVAITGDGFATATAVTVGGVAVPHFLTLDDNHIVLPTPPGSGTQHIIVTNPNGASTPTSTDQFTYISPPTVTVITPNPMPFHSFSGAQTVDLHGTNLDQVTEVDFAGQPGTNLHIVSPTELTIDPPPPPYFDPDTHGGTTITRPVNAVGKYATDSHEQFTWFLYPFLDTPPQPLTGAAGDQLTLSGNYLQGVEAIQFGSTTIPLNVPYQFFNVHAITFTVPPGTGTVLVHLVGLAQVPGFGQVAFPIDPTTGVFTYQYVDKP